MTKMINLFSLAKTLAFSGLVALCGLFYGVSWYAFQDTIGFVAIVAAIILAVTGAVIQTRAFKRKAAKIIFFAVFAVAAYLIFMYSWMAYASLINQAGITSPIVSVVIIALITALIRAIVAQIERKGVKNTLRAITAYFDGFGPKKPLNPIK